MSEIKEAVAGVKNLLAQFQALGKVAEVLETISNLEKAHADSVVSMNHYKKQEAEAKEQAVSAQSKLAAIVKEVREAEGQKAAALSSLHAERQEMVNAFDKQKQTIVAKSELRLVDIEATLKAKKEECAVLDEEINKKKSELDKMLTKTANLKNNLEAFIG